MEEDSGTRATILAAAREVLTRDSDASIDTIAQAADVSRATFYRHLRSRAELLDALEIAPDPDTRDRVLAAAADLIGRDGLREMSMDELAARAGVSRASVYRLFPGKPALFDALLEAYSPFAAIMEVLECMADRPANEVLPAITHAAARVGAPRVGVLRSLIFEVSSGSPDALAGTDRRLAEVIGAISSYLTKEMAAGRIRPTHPVLAAQALMGPVILHVLSRAEIEHLGAIDLSLDAAVDRLADAALHGLASDAAAPDRPARRPD